MTSLPVATGIGLRQPHYADFCATLPDIAFIEVHAENFMAGGAPLEMLQDLARKYPVSLHAIGLSPGSSDGIDPAHLNRFASLVDRIKPAAISDHLSWSTAPGSTIYSNDLLPLPLNDESLAITANNIRTIQDRLGRAIMIENPSSYMQFDGDTISEWDFLAALTDGTGCDLLLDVNNIIVGKHNHGFDPDLYLNSLNGESIKEIHIAGHAVRQIDETRQIRIDDHGSAADDETRGVLEKALQQFGPRPVLLERDSNIPTLTDLLTEAADIQNILKTGKAAPYAA